MISSNELIEKIESSIKSKDFPLREELEFNPDLIKGTDKAACFIAGFIAVEMQSTYYNSVKVSWKEVNTAEDMLGYETCLETFDYLSGEFPGQSNSISIYVMSFSHGEYRIEWELDGNSIYMDIELT